VWQQHGQASFGSFVGLGGATVLLMMVVQQEQEDTLCAKANIKHKLLVGGSNL